MVKLKQQGHIEVPFTQVLFNIIQHGGQPSKLGYIENSGNNAPEGWKAHKINSHN